MPNATMKIGEVARRAGVSVDTVRFYERRGILPPAPRRASGYRMYSEATTQRIGFARTLQSLGLSLDEIVEMLAAVDAGTATCENQQFRIESVVQRIDAKLRELRATRRKAVQVLQACRVGTCALREDIAPG